MLWLCRPNLELGQGLREPSGIHASWFIQYLDNNIHEGHTKVEINADRRNPQLFGGTVTRYCVQRRAHLFPDASGTISVSGNATDVIVEGCTLDNARNEINVDGETSGVLLRNNKFTGAAKYGGDGLKGAVVVPARP